MRLNPFGGGKTEYHPGIDIGVPVGTPIAAAAAGTVIIVDWVSGYGNYIWIDHCGGISTGYGHLDTFLVSVSAARADHRDVRQHRTFHRSASHYRSSP